tara:strand:+ start:1208 stop:1414 length:207 start_codon:yes stop_codon:yes gene_type:complete
MIGEVTRELGNFDAPWGKQVAIVEVDYGDGIVVLRIRIREGRRFTIIDVDADTASRWAEAMSAWAGER